MIGLRTLEIKFQRPIILAHLSWPVEKKLRVHFKKIPALVGLFKAYSQEVGASLRVELSEKIENLQTGGTEYVAGLQETLRGKRALSRGSVSFFLLNISDYGNNPSNEPVAVRVKVKNAEKGE